MHNRMKSDPTPFSKKRGHLQVMFEILEICKHPQNKTRIMQQATLSYNQLRAVLEVLEKYKLLEVKEGSRKKYVASARGKEYAQKYNELQKMTTQSDYEEKACLKKGKCE